MNAQCKCEIEKRGNFCSECGERLKPDLFHLVEDYKRKEVKEALDRYSYDLEARNEFNNTVLHLAVMKGSNLCTEVLLDHKADPNAGNAYGSTALHLAAERGYKNCLQALLDHGADMNAKENGKTALEIAANRSNKNCLQLLVDRGATVSPETRRRYPQFADLWPKDLQGLLMMIEDVKQQLAGMEAYINDLQSE